MGYDIPDNVLDEFAASDNQAQSTDVQSQPVAQAQSSFDPNLMINYKASGKDLNENLATVIQRAQRGYDYAQLVEQHKQKVAREEAIWQQKQAELSNMEQTWKPYHDYAQQNPQWAEFVRQQWESRFNANQAQPIDFSQQQQQQPVNPNLPPEIQRELFEMRQFMNEVKQQQEAARIAEQDAALHTEIDGIRKAYPDIDFGHTDPETGESLELRVLRHAQENGIHNFSAAFKDFYFDKLLERQVLKAKEEAAKTIQNNQKQGFLAQSDKPMLVQDQGSPRNYRNMSYSNLADLAIRDMGL